MAEVDCAGPLQLLRGTGKPRQSRRIPGSVNWAVVAYPSPPQPETSDLLDAYSRPGRPMVSSTASTPSLPRGSLCRQSSAIRTGCANKRPSGSVRGYHVSDIPTGISVRANGPLRSKFCAEQAAPNFNVAGESIQPCN